MLLQVLDNGSAVTPRETLNFIGPTITDVNGVTTLDFSGLNPSSIGDTTVQAGKTITWAAGSGGLDAHLGTGDFKLSTGAVSWAGASSKALSLVSTAAGITIKSATSGTVLVDSAAALNLGTADATSVTIGSASVAASVAGGLSVAAGKSITMASGAGGIDGHLGTGAFRFGTSAATLAFFGATAVALQTAAADVTGFVAGAGSTAKSDSVWAGSTGSTAYTVGDLVTALKKYGLLTA
jgi:hypothetical protein